MFARVDDPKDVAALCGVVHVLFAMALHTVQANGQVLHFNSIGAIIYPRPFVVFMIVVTIGAQFGIVYGAVLVFYRFNLVTPGVVIIGFALWSIGTTITNWPSIVRGQYDVVLPFTLNPVPYIAQWIPILAILLLTGGLEYLSRMAVERKLATDDR
jgi:hypothetical protein